MCEEHRYIVEEHVYMGEEHNYNCILNESAEIGLGFSATKCKMW